MKLGKSPGFDGLPLEFYKIFRSELTPHQHELFRYCLAEGVMPHSWKETRLVVVPKIFKYLRYAEAYRPISVLNADYKVFALVLANRLSSVIGTYVHSEQTGFIKGETFERQYQKCNEYSR